MTMKRRTFRILPTLATLVCLVAVPALADTVRNVGERVSDNAEIRQDHREQSDDLWDLARLEAMTGRFDAARESGDIRTLRHIDLQLRGAVATELRESHAELAGDRAEVARNNREVRASRREVARDVRRDASAGEQRDDRHDLRDDRRDRRDDRRDARAEARTLERRTEIATELRDLLGEYDDPSLDRKRALLGELTVMARAEVSANERELREDRRERREDRRERREDRRSGS
jgi:hypothetical protein